MPVIISFVLLILVAYFVLATGESGVASFLPWADRIRALVSGNLLLANGIALGSSVAGFFTAGASVMLVRGKTLVIGSKKTLVFFTVLFIITSIILGMRFFDSLQPMLHGLAARTR